MIAADGSCGRRIIRTMRGGARAANIQAIESRGEVDRSCVAPVGAGGAQFFDQRGGQFLRLRFSHWRAP